MRADMLVSFDSVFALKYPGETVWFCRVICLLKYQWLLDIEVYRLLVAALVAGPSKRLAHEKNG
jgi:hypothetical protein